MTDHTRGLKIQVTSTLEWLSCVLLIHVKNHTWLRLLSCVLTGHPLVQSELEL